MKTKLETSEDAREITAERYQTDEYARQYKTEYQTGTNLKSLRSRLIARLECATIVKILDAMNIKGRVLDVPCGTGKLGPILSRYPVTITAADISKSMMKMAEGEYDKDKFEGFELCDVCKMEYSDRTFDSIICLRLFQRLPRESRIEALKEFARVTKSNLVISYSQATPWQKIKNKAKSTITWMSERKIPIFFHVPKREIIKELTSAGFKINQCLNVSPVISSQIIFCCSVETRDQ